MWIVGTLIALAACVAVVLRLGWHPRAVPSPPLWDVSNLGANYTGIVGTIAGFSIASAIFIAGLSDVRSSPFYATEIGMLIIAFLILVFSALTLASTPNLREATSETAQAIAHDLANLCGCLGLSVSWLALVPLLDLLGLPDLADAFTWLLLFVAVTGGGWIALFAYRLTLASARTCLTFPVLGFALAALYRLVAARMLPPLWPASDAALRFAFVAFGLAGFCFSIHSALLLAHGSPVGTRWLPLIAHRVALACGAAYSLIVSLIWFAIAAP